MEDATLGMRRQASIQHWAQLLSNGLLQDTLVGSGGRDQNCPFLEAVPEGPSTQYLRTLVPNTIKSMGFGNQRYLDPLGVGASAWPVS